MKLLISLLLAIHLLGWFGSIRADEKSPSDVSAIDFDRDILPLLQQRCFECHGEKSQEAGFRLDQADAAKLGGDSGKSIIPGNSAGSRLIEYVSGTNPEHVMPPEGDRLTDKEIGMLRAWIDRGANFSDGCNSKLPTQLIASEAAFVCSDRSYL